MRGNGSGSVHVEHLAEDVAHHAFHELHDVFLIQERGFDVELGEFGLAVGAQVLVAKTAHDLVVALEARHHQQLLEDLRRLGKREEARRDGCGSAPGSRARPRGSPW